MTDVLGGNLSQQQQQPVVVLPIQTPAPAATAPLPGYMPEAQVQDLIGRVRAEEKDKLYPEMSALTDEVAALKAERDQRLAAVAEAQRQAEEEEERQRQAVLTQQQRWEEEVTGLRTQFNEQQQELERERILRQKETELMALGEYRSQRLAESQDDIDPRFFEYIRGNSREEIDASVNAAKQKTAEIQAEIAQAFNPAPPALPSLPVVPVSGAPSMDSSLTPGEGQSRQLTNDELRNLTPEEYEQLRPQLMNAMKGAVRERGVYGA